VIHFFHFSKVRFSPRLPEASKKPCYEYESRGKENLKMIEIHERALLVVKRFKQAEADLILVLQEIDASRVFAKMGFTSLFQYCVESLGLSENVTANFIAVARKAREVPVLQSAIQNGSLTVSKARKITPVLTLANQEEWVEKAQTLSSRKLEEEVARVAPREAVQERVRPICEDRFELRLGISKALEEKLRRVQDLESQRTSHAASFESALDAALEIYLERNDPIRRAERILKKSEKRSVRSDAQTLPASEPSSQAKTNRESGPAHRLERVPGHVPQVVKHLVQKRDGGRCAHEDSNGRRCENRRWLDIHHIRPRSLGGLNKQENLTTLCSAHHKMEHSAI
jgi:5-methylcytosine-specific restriction endonuclease McrA